MVMTMTLTSDFSLYSAVHISFVCS